MFYRYSYFVSGGILLEEGLFFPNLSVGGRGGFCIFAKSSARDLREKERGFGSEFLHIVFLWLILMVYFTENSIVT